MLDQHAVVPETVRDRVEALAARTGERFTLRPMPPGRATPGAVWVAQGTGCVAHIAADPQGAARLRLELAARHWARAAGVAVPPLSSADSGGRWLVSTVVPQDPESPATVRAVVGAATRLARRPLPSLPAPAASWRASKRSWARLFRSVTALPVAEFRRARTLAMSQPTAPAHGDLNEGNALWDAGDGVVRLIDFEYVGAYPWGWDASTYWVHLPDAEQRALLLDLVLGDPHGPDRRGFGALLHWHSLRHLADLVATVPRREQEPAGVAVARARLDEARALVRCWGSPG